MRLCILPTSQFPGHEYSRSPAQSVPMTLSTAGGKPAESQDHFYICTSPLSAPLSTPPLPLYPPRRTSTDRGAHPVVDFPWFLRLFAPLTTSSRQSRGLWRLSYASAQLCQSRKGSRAPAARSQGPWWVPEGPGPVVGSSSVPQGG